MPVSSHPELKPFQAIILVLSVVAVAALGVELLFVIPPRGSTRDALGG